MTGRSTILALLFLSFLIPLTAYADVYVEPGVYKKTADRWSSAVSSSSFRSDSWIWRMPGHDKKHKNNFRDSILMVPESASPDDITVIVWMHGCSGFSQRTFDVRIIKQFSSVVHDKHSVAVAVPEMPWSINTSTRCGRQGKVWRNNYSLQNYVSDLRDKLSAWSIREHNVPLGSLRIVVVGHSAGGSAIMSASREGSLCRIKPEAVVWSDATYGKWFQRAWKGCMSNLKADLHVVVRKWDRPHHNVNRFIKNLQSFHNQLFYKVLDRKKWHHRDIGDGIINLTNIFPLGC